MARENKKIRTKSLAGTTLVETLIAVFIFSMTATMLSGVFSNFLRNYSMSKKLQQNVENAQYAMNLMAKTLRTSKIIEFNLNNSSGTSCVPPSGCSGGNAGHFSIKAYDYSQSQCYRYVITNSGDTKPNSFTISTATGTISNESDCETASTFSTPVVTASNVQQGNFNIDYGTGASGIVGKVTIVLNVGFPGQTAGQGSARVQTTVSLRNQ